MSEPLRFKLKLGPLLSPPPLPEACAFICEPEVVPAKLKVTGDEPIIWLKLWGTFVGVTVRSNCMEFPLCWTRQFMSAEIVPDN